MSELAYELPALLNDLARLIRTEADKRARAHGMTRAQWMILSRVERTPGLSQRELAEILEVEPITVGRLVDRLEGRGLVERRADAGDRRIWRLHLRPEAASILAVLDVQREAIGKLVSEGIDAAVLERVTDALLRMKANIGACRRAQPDRDLQETA
jgi:MarR family transcriptional regulator, transcriptional regulator for hemolysin